MKSPVWLFRLIEEPQLGQLERKEPCASQSHRCYDSPILEMSKLRFRDKIGSGGIRKWQLQEGFRSCPKKLAMKLLFGERRGREEGGPFYSLSPTIAHVRTTGPLEETLGRKESTK